MMLFVVSNGWCTGGEQKNLQRKAWKKFVVVQDLVALLENAISSGLELISCVVDEIVDS